MNLKQLQWYWGIFVETWKLFRKYNSVHGDAEWEQLIGEATKLRKKYPGDFSQKIIIAVLEELDGRDSNERNTNNAGSKKQNR